MARKEFSFVGLQQGSLPKIPPKAAQLRCCRSNRGMAEKPAAATVLSPGSTSKHRSSISGEKPKFSEEKGDKHHDRPKFADVDKPKFSEPKPEKSPSADKARKDKAEGAHNSPKHDSPSTPPPPPVNLAATIPADVLEKVVLSRCSHATCNIMLVLGVVMAREASSNLTRQGTR